MKYLINQYLSTAKKNLILKLTITNTKIFHRTNIGNLALTLTLQTTQKIKGITSELENNKHVILFDFDDVQLYSVEKHLKRIQRENNLSDIYIYSDKPRSYRAYCFKQVTFNEWLKLYIQLPDWMIDFNFLRLSIIRGYITSRYTEKAGRPKQQLITTLESYYIPPPINELKTVQYITPTIQTHDTNK